MACNKRKIIQRMNLSRYILVLIAMLAAARMAAQDTTEVLSLNDCIRIGVNNATQILRSKDSVKLTGIDLLAAYGQFLPGVYLNGTDNYINGRQLLTIEQPTVVYSRENELDYQVTGSFNIFNGFKDYASLKASLLNKKAFEYTYERAKQAVAYDITQTYLQVVLDSHITKFAVQNYTASLRREDQLRDETRVGRTTISDLLQQEAQTSQDKLYLIRSKNKLKDDRILLLTKLRITNTGRYRFADMQADTIPINLNYDSQDSVVNVAYDYRTDLKASDLRVRMAYWNIRQSQSGYYPALNLAGGLYSYGGYYNYLSLNGQVQPLDQQPPLQAYFGQVYGGVQLVLTWSIFDKLMTKTSVDRARVYQDLAQIDRDDLAINISADIKRAYNDYADAQQDLETATAGLESANSSYGVQQDRFKVGNSTFIELSNSQITYLQAQVNKEQSAMGLMLQKITINYYIGK
jgi:outer membrane protein